MKPSSLWRFIVSTSLGFIFLTVFSFNGFAAEEYVFERMWPVLEQPWYFHFPEYLAIDGAGNVYITEQGSDRIKKFTSSGTYVTGWGGPGTESGRFDSPLGVAIDASGNVYVADWGNHRIQKFTSSGEFIIQWGTKGNGDGELYHPIDLAIDPAGNVYVTDNWNERIQKFTADGVFLSKWGKYGSGEGEFDSPMGIAIDSKGNVYVSEYGSHRVQKFTSNGAYITKWGSQGFGNGEFSHPEGLAIDISGSVYVVDNNNHRIQVFDNSGMFLREWGNYGADKGQLDVPVGIAMDRKGNVYVADAGNCRIQKFTTKGAFMAKWDSAGNGDGQFNDPRGIAMDAAGNIYVADQWNNRIQKFSAAGVFITRWGKYGSSDGEFKYPNGISTDSSGNVYVADFGNHRIQKFSASGDFLNQWGVEGDGEGEFQSIADIAVDAYGDVYVADLGNDRIQKFNASGIFITQWGSEGSGDGQLDSPWGVAIDASGNVYVADWGNHRIQKFNSTGVFITKWGSEGVGDGELYHPIGIAVDDIGHVYVADAWNYRIQKFNSDGTFIAQIGAKGSAPGLLNAPGYLLVSPQGEIFVTEMHNNRVQVFAPASETVLQKAIIVAGSGPYEGNILWPATQMCANYAFRSLNFQGYSAENIFYLSANMYSDSDADGIPDADADATNANLEYAVKTWATDATNLLIYMVGHGGEGTFQIGQFELLDASTLAGWLDAAQQSIPQFVALVYDGCHSGSFLPYLIPSSGGTRIVATSAGPNEPAVFEADGGLSFGYQFFSYLFNGGSFYESFVHGKKTVEGAYDYKQTPQIDGNGNGISNEKADREIAATIKLGNETKTAGDIPQIQSVSPAQTLAEGETSAVIYAQNVIDANGIQEVFAVIKPPNYSSGSSDKPVTDLPTIYLTDVGNNTYSGMYNGFTVGGTYNVAVFARDRKGTLSLPSQTSVTVSGTTSCLVVASDLSIQVPCANYIGNQYGFILDFYHNPDDLSGYYWKLIVSTLTVGSGDYCIPIGADLSMPITCVSYNGAQFAFLLDFYSNPYDPSGLYWRMDTSTLVVK